MPVKVTMLQFHARTLGPIGDEPDLDLAGFRRVSLDLPMRGNTPADDDAVRRFVSEDASPTTFSAVHAAIINTAADTPLEYRLGDLDREQVVLAWLYPSNSSVKTLNARSIGTSTVVSTRMLVSGSPFIVSFLPSGFRILQRFSLRFCFHPVFEYAERFRPITLEVRLQRSKCLRINCVKTACTFGAVRYQVCSLENPEMLRYRGAGHRKPLGEFADGERPIFHQAGENGPTRSVTEGIELYRRVVRIHLR